MSAESLRLRALAAALTLLSGAVMMLAGFVGATESWSSAGFITIPGGVAILSAFALARRADRADGRTVATGGGHQRERGAAMAATLLSGGVMVVRGLRGVRVGVGARRAPRSCGRPRDRGGVRLRSPRHRVKPAYAEIAGAWPT